MRFDEDADARHDASEHLLRRALIDDSSSVAVSLRVGGLPVSEAVTVIFHGRRDLGTLQTYITPGSRGAGATVAANQLLRVPATSTSLTPRIATRRRSCIWSRPPRCATPWSERTSCSTSARAALRADRIRSPGRLLRRAAGTASRPEADADRARRSGVPAAGDPGVQRPHPCRGPAPDGDRVRAAGRHASLSAGRRPGALRGGLPARRRRSRAGPR